MHVTGSSVTGSSVTGSNVLYIAKALQNVIIVFYLCKVITISHQKASQIASPASYPPPGAPPLDPAGGVGAASPDPSEHSATAPSYQTAFGRLRGAVNDGKFHWPLGQKVQVTLWLLGAAPQAPAKLLGTQNRSLELLALVTCPALISPSM